MRKLFVLSSVALVAGAMLAFTSCSKDESKSNKFTVDGVDYEVVDATLKNYGNNKADFQGYNTGISFYGESVIYFDACSTIGTALDKRTYEYSESLPYAIGTFSPDSGSQGLSLTKGTLTVKAVSGDRYEIEFSCEDETGKQITGYYKGTVSYEDRTIPQQ